MQLSTTVMTRGPAQFNMAGQFLGYPLKNMAKVISPGLAQRLARYAVQRVTETGFEPLLKDADIEVYTADGDYPPSDRSYAVKFKTPKGGYLELVGIFTRRGWPSLDHGFAIGTD